MTSSSRRSGFELNRPFVGIPSFLRAPIETRLDALDAEIAVFGIPFDEGSRCGSPPMPGSTIR